MNIFFWYPKCSTCQKAKKFLDQKQISYQMRNIKEQPLTSCEIQELIQKYKIELKKLWNTSGILYREKNLKEALQTMSDDQKIELLASDGMLVKRPILIGKDRVWLGFREKEWEEIK